MNEYQYRQIAKKCDLVWGRMICSSKSKYREENPNHKAVFNAAIFTSTQKIWWGDLDISVDDKRLQNFANELGEDIFILSEQKSEHILLEAASNEINDIRQNAIAFFVAQP